MKKTIKDCQVLAIAKRGQCLSNIYKNNKSKLTWKCEKNHVWEASYNSISRGRWCPQCAVRVTLNDCKKIANKNGGLCLSDKYINNKSPLIWKCGKCNYIWSTTYSNVRNGCWCPKCVNKHKKNIYFCQKLAQKNGGKCLSKNVNHSSDKLLWLCSCGFKWNSTYGNIKSGSWCPKCRNRLPITVQDCYSLAKEKNGKVISDHKKIIANKTKIKWMCNNCHFQWKATYSLIKGGSWCPSCAGVKRVTIEDCKREAIKNNGKFISNKVLNTYTKVWWQCHHNHTWEATYSDIRKGRWCPLCVNKTQSKIYNICKEIFKNETVLNNFTGFDWLRAGNGVGKKMEFDIFVPHLKLAIEYDGEQHFKPVRFGGMSLEKAQKCFIKQQKRDIIKNNLVKQHSEDVQTFLRISYKEEISKKHIYNRIMKALNETTSWI